MFVYVYCVVQAPGSFAQTPVPAACKNYESIVKKVQDHYFRKAKKEGYPARSVYKLEAVQKKFRLLKRGDTVLDLGCQPGSWSLYAAKILGPGGLVVGVDLQKGRPLRQPGGAEIRLLCGDILADGVQQELKAVRARYDVVLSDMAPRTTGNKFADQQQSLTLARQVLDLARQLLREGGSLYCKVFEGEDVREFIDAVRRHFTMTKIVKPKSSRPESREVFVLGMGFKNV